MEPNVGRSLLVACFVMVTVTIPMILGKVPPNRFYGFRTPRTLSKPEIWYPANRFSGWALFIAGVVSFAALSLLPEEVVARPGVAVAVFVGPLLTGMAASFVYLRRLR